jgi:hypothetical protein
MELSHLDRICFVWTINFHLAMQAICKDKMMGHTKPVRFHRVIRTKIDTPHIPIIKVRDFVLGTHLLKKKRHEDRTKSILKKDYTEIFQVCLDSVER